MKKQEFIDLVVEELEIEDVTVSLDTVLSSIEEWDSMGKMVMIGLVSEHFSVKLTNADIKSLTDVSSLISKIGEEKFS